MKKMLIKNIGILATAEGRQARRGEEDVYKRQVYDCIYNGSVGGFKGIDPSYPQTVFFHECYRIK